MYCPKIPLAVFAALILSCPLLSSAKIKTPVVPVSPFLLSDYKAYWHAMSVFESVKLPTQAQIENAERTVLLAKLNSPVRTLEKELDEIFWGLELKRGEVAASNKKYPVAIKSFQRGLQGLPSLKLPYYWRESFSVALAKICVRDKKKNDEECLALAKKVADIFPKVAVETKALRDLPSSDLSGNAVASSDPQGDRLSSTYPADKTDKDEKDFELVLAAYLSESESELSKKSDEFIQNYPKSALRFRVQFLIAELNFKKGKLKEAEKIYQILSSATPFGFYALISAERLKISQKDKLKKISLVTNSEPLNFNSAERLTLQRVEELVRLKKWDEAGLELDTLQRTRAYSLNNVLYLMSYAYKIQQYLCAFKFVSELIQRQYDGLLSAELMEMIFPFAYEKEIQEASTLYKTDPLVIMSLTKQESGFRSTAISTSGALGLMQIMPFTALDVQPGVKLFTLKNAAPNIMMGTKYLASLLEKYEGNAVYALAAYNAGPHRVSKWRKELKPGASMIDFIEAIPFKETRDYVMSILRNRYWYQVRKGNVPTSLFDTWKF